MYDNFQSTFYSLLLNSEGKFVLEAKALRLAPKLLFIISYFG